MTDIRTEKQLRAILVAVSKVVIKEVSAKILKKLQDNIWDYTYKYDYYPNKVYLNSHGHLPSGDFLKAWRWENIQTSVFGVVTELYYDYTKLRKNTEPWFHGSEIKGWDKDSRPYLQKILNEPSDGEYTSSLMVGDKHFSKRRKPYWDITVDELDQGEILRMFDEELRKFGFVRN